MEIRKASMSDWEEIQKIYAGARKFMAEHGNAGQWGTTNPREELLMDDIAQGKLYVCTEKSIAAVFFFAAEEDHTYRIIEDGAWLNDEPYGVVHRIASAGTVRGAASFCMNWAFRQMGNIRIDTHEDNIPMQNMLKKNGFRYCGKIHLENGEPRIAFQKIHYTVKIEQTYHYPNRMKYIAETDSFVEKDVKSIFYVRNIRQPYGWIKESGTPPCEHLDVIVMTDKEYELGDEDRIKIIGVFRRNDGDHKLVGVLEDRDINDFSELTETEKEDMHRLYPRADAGEGWFGRECAEEILKDFVSPKTD